MHTVLLLLLAASRQPLPVPQAPPRAQPLPAAVAAPEGPPPSRAEARRVALSVSAGALVGRPVLELEVAPIDHVSGYVQGELGFLAGLGYGAQAGVRLRPMRGLVGPFLDVHLRHSRFVGVTSSTEEALSPGVLVGGTLVSDGGFMLSGGLGLSFLAKTTETRWGLESVSGPVVSLAIPTASSTTTLGPVPELRLQLGYAF